jgi:putative SOS response-associated peptidase YedK
MLAGPGWQAERMCGRYAANLTPDYLVEEFDVDRVEIDGPLEPDFNVAPTKDVYAILTRRPRLPDPEESGADGEVPDQQAPVRQLRVLRWGLVPSWAKDPSIGSRLINARVETVAEKPAFRHAFARRRCLLPADGYFEWYASEHSGPGRRPKQPFFIHRKDSGVLAMAGLYEFWRDARLDRDDPGAWLVTCTILTTTAEDSLGRIHDRMPMLVEAAGYDAWLDPDNDDPDRLRTLLVPATPDRLEAYPVSTAVNNVKNNGPELLEPVAPES